MTKCFIILPNQLFEIKYLVNPKDYKFFIIEEPLFFGDKRRVKNFSKLKLVLHRASMKYYFDYLKKEKIDVEYIDYKKIKNYSFIKECESVSMFDPVDHLFKKTFCQVLKKKKLELEIFDTPLFLL